jgi:hypothetical protein
VTWLVERVVGPPRAFHERVPAAPVRRTVWVAAPTDAALVLGSTQSVDVVAPSATIDVVKRRSGGGAVLVEPGAQLWLDVVVSTGDPLHDDDVGRSFAWLADVWRSALAELGVPATIHAGPLVSTRWSKLICFAGLGPGELLDDAGRKVVGISQRRTRAWSRFQCSVPLLPWDPAPIVALLALSPEDVHQAVADLTDTVGHIPLDHESLLEAFLTHLP